MKKLKFKIGWINHRSIKYFNASAERRSLDKGTTFKNCGDTYSDGTYELEYCHTFEADDIVRAINYTKKYVRNSPHDIEVFCLTHKKQVIFTEENLED